MLGRSDLNPTSNASIPDNLELCTLKASATMTRTSDRICMYMCKDLRVHQNGTVFELRIEDFHAAKNSNMDRLKYYYDGASVNVVDLSGETPLDYNYAGFAAIWLPWEDAV
ncbi:hypothetical protein N7478_008550 [Penicillium angulare]|uniref:uncharacterized protein n=1 Tax=Penicillium angulare TaxID=116970 RepID=UPI0025421CF4|nr:uncharacterized protein N7478_008550 [Penicillium angulare]KAJ5273425.1 hypothetical protein N7478_008550 [Penicillium angulare]